MYCHINGDTSRIVGQRCDKLYLLQQREEGIVTDPAMVTYFRFGDQWMTLHINDDTVFWRRVQLPSQLNDNYEALLVAYQPEGVFQHVVENIKYGSSDEHVEVRLSFSSGRILNFKYHCFEDYTSINIG